MSDDANAPRNRFGVRVEMPPNPLSVRVAQRFVVRDEADAVAVGNAIAEAAAKIARDRSLILAGGRVDTFPFDADSPEAW